VGAPAQERGEFDPDRAWRLHPQVAVRPEPFGALLYHFGTRKLSFLKNRTILAVVQSLADHPDVRAACRAAGVDDFPNSVAPGSDSRFFISVFYYSCRS